MRQDFEPQSMYQPVVSPQTVFPVPTTFALSRSHSGYVCSGTRQLQRSISIMNRDDIISMTTRIGRQQVAVKLG